MHFIFRIYVEKKQQLAYAEHWAGVHCTDYCNATELYPVIYAHHITAVQATIDITRIFAGVHSNSQRVHLQLTPPPQKKNYFSPICAIPN